MVLIKNPLSGGGGGGLDTLGENSEVVEDALVLSGATVKKGDFVQFRPVSVTSDTNTGFSSVTGNVVTQEVDNDRCLVFTVTSGKDLVAKIVKTTYSGGSDTLQFGQETTIMSSVSSSAGIKIYPFKMSDGLFAVVAPTTRGVYMAAAFRVGSDDSITVGTTLSNIANSEDLKQTGATKMTDTTFMVSGYEGNGYLSVSICSIDEETLEVTRGTAVQFSCPTYGVVTMGTMENGVAVLYCLIASSPSNTQGNIALFSASGTVITLLTNTADSSNQFRNFPSPTSGSYCEMVASGLGFSILRYGIDRESSSTSDRRVIVKANFKVLANDNSLVMPTTTSSMLVNSDYSYGEKNTEIPIIYGKCGSTEYYSTIKTTNSSTDTYYRGVIFGDDKLYNSVNTVYYSVARFGAKLLVCFYYSSKVSVHMYRLRIEKARNRVDGLALEDLNAGSFGKVAILS